MDIGFEYVQEVINIKIMLTGDVLNGAAGVKRLAIMTVGKTHSGETTFGKASEKE